MHRANRCWQWLESQALRIRRRFRKWRWSHGSGNMTIRFTERDGSERIAVPLSAVGLQLRCEVADPTGRSFRLISPDQTTTHDAFLRSWYALGGGNVHDEDGTPVDPDDMI